MMRIKRVAVTADGHRFYVKDTAQDLHTQYGVLSKKDFRKSAALSNTGKRFRLYSPGFADAFQKIRRGPQMIPLKDLGAVIAHTGMGKRSVVVDSGSGSGGSALVFAQVAKTVHSYELREDFLEIARKNKEMLDVKNVSFELHDITQGIPIKNVDILLLDIPTPWLVVRHAASSLKRGGFLVSYSPTVPQVSDFIAAVKESEMFITPWTIEISEREWEFEGRKVRPKSQRIGHSGFLTFTRRLG